MSSALEARLNASCMGRMTNARGDFGAEDFPIIFDNAFVDMSTGAGALRPTAAVEDGNIPDTFKPNTSVLCVDATTSYMVRDAQPDGTGWTLLILEKQS